MNQFKRAKQINIQSESATDLKTAGVAAPKEKSPKQGNETPIKKEENSSVNLNTESTNLTQPIISNRTQPVIPEENTILSKTEVPAVAAENSINVVTQSPQTEIISDNMPVEKPEIISQPAVYNEASALQAANAHPQIISSPQTAQPVMQPQYTEANITYAEPPETKPAKSSKKSAPNMFTKKNESKSIRKSLVLRPSSVKIAENYCAKNGGSFNELIQILLDNFIEEYGL